MKERLIIGLMSGTSVDAIDAALVRVGRRKDGRYTAQVLEHVEVPWAAEERRRLLAVMAPAQTTTQEICELNVVVAQAFAGAAEKLLRRARVKREQIAAIGTHGQTVCHLPRATKLKMGSTFQIGDPSVIATLTGIVTVGNFRPADMAVGGQWAPLVPFADAMLLSDRAKTRCVQNIGGIANVTFLPAGNAVPRTDAKQVIAFDTGPGNMVMDTVVAIATRGRERFDRDGRMAVTGESWMNRCFASSSSTLYISNAAGRRNRPGARKSATHSPACSSTESKVKNGTSRILFTHWRDSPHGRSPAPIRGSFRKCRTK